ncbi:MULTISPECIES: fluoride efflux transporter CrcB [Nonlabens]|uniref:Fluoride-specific ion channel FluC n=1 Tax=Nonlabens ulvanivorans TaxID=906888 RepID=A0A084JWA1_NONUL|nr:fluoride efflux transporter CrcB [Nonlabens ulvanivorans]KEZ93235.1 CrcB protein [Nonlabens ulvanivorans]PRX13642.1 camphor resistance protein CrcB [Nonlabens ulvanivorans]WOI23905.1 fluoride efflux transporter CrcB [Nonlabens ulvanivorans]
MIKQLLLVFIGGGFGCVLRFLFSVWINTDQIKWIPTIVANVIGCFLLGLFLSLSHKNILDSHGYILLGIGFCGGLTTFSTFSVDVFKLTNESNYLGALIYLLLTIILGYIAVYCAYYLGKQLN